ncbi:hypothetical protein ACROYT_G014688 [Oculina patagonica]
MEETIVSWLNVNYETGKDTDFIPKESLWDEFVNERVVNFSREEFFTRLERCIGQSSLKGIKSTRCKGKRNGYKGLRKKQGRNEVQSCHSDFNSKKRNKEESSKSRGDDAEVPPDDKLEDSQFSSEKMRGVCQENAHKEEAGIDGEAFQENALKDQVDCLGETIFEDVVTGAEAWTDDESNDDDEAIKCQKSKKRKPSSSSSSSSTLGLGSSKSWKRKTRHQIKRKPVLVSSEEEEHSPERFYQNHHRKFKCLLPKHLPNRPRTFRDYLCSILKMPKTENPRRIDIHSHSAGVVTNDSALRRSFIAASFPPVKVGQVAGVEIKHTFPGDMFPQFTHHGKSNYHCEICIPFQRWATTNGVKHSALKSKQLTIDDIINDTAILNFSGVVQVHEHSNSKSHQEAIDFFKRDLTEKVAKAHGGKPVNKVVTITDYFGSKKPLN